MTTSGTRPFLILATLAIAAWHTTAIASKSAVFPVRTLDPDDAVSLVRVRVPEAHDCTLAASRATDRMTAGQRGVVTVNCDREEITVKIGEALAVIDSPPVTRRFHVTILEASRKDGPTPELPPSEAKALADAKKVMTYRSFRLDAETILQTDGRASALLGGTYWLDLAMAPSKADIASINVERFRLMWTHTPAAGEKAEAGGPLFETSFSIREGETIVLGSSAAGDAARMVLVTVLP